MQPFMLSQSRNNMKKDSLYKNQQKVSETNGDVLTYFYKSGNKKAEGKYINEKFEGKWLFYRENGQLQQEGHFKDNQKDGEWIRFNTKGEIEYHAEFKEGKEVKKASLK